jgi:hypothetical protein
VDFLFKIELVEKSHTESDYEQYESGGQGITEFKLLKGFAIEIIYDNHGAFQWSAAWGHHVDLSENLK